MFFQSKVLKAVAVDDVRQSVQKMMQKVVTDEVGTVYSLCGRAKRTGDEKVSTSKHGFEKTNLFKLIYGK